MSLDFPLVFQYRMAAQAALLHTFLPRQGSSMLRTRFTRP